MTDRVLYHELKGTIEQAVKEYEGKTGDKVKQLVINPYVDMNTREMKKQVTIITEETHGK